MTLIGGGTICVETASIATPAGLANACTNLAYSIACKPGELGSHNGDAIAYGNANDDGSGLAAPDYWFCSTRR